jgi:DNA-binding winged helix-turn-helix (wHTH) protein
MEKRARQLLQNMEAQLATLNEQVLMTQAAIQILELLLASPDEATDEIPDNEIDQVAG